nr:transposase family protein [Cyanobium sp. LEGE 06113]
MISFLKAIPDARMRRGIRIPAWYLLLVALLGILSRCQSLRDLERFAIRHHSVLCEALGIELRRPPSDSAFRYFFRQVDVRSLRCDPRLDNRPDPRWCSRSRSADL